MAIVDPADSDSISAIGFNHRSRRYVYLNLPPEVIRDAHVVEIPDTRRPADTGPDSPYLLRYNGAEGLGLVSPVDATRTPGDFLGPPESVHDRLVDARILNLEIVAMGQQGQTRLLGAAFNSLSNTLSPVVSLPRPVRNAIAHLTAPFADSTLWDWLAMRMVTVRNTHIYRLMVSNVSDETLALTLQEMRGGDPNSTFPSPPDFDAIEARVGNPSTADPGV